MTQGAADSGSASASTSTHTVWAESPQMGVAAGLIDGHHVSRNSVTNGSSTSTPQTVSQMPNGAASGEADSPPMKLEVEDGSSFIGTSFGAHKSIAGEVVFQTGMVGYPESITDPSYRGQILVITFPLIGNYGVPSRETVDETLGNLPAHFEASQIHIAGLVVASYSGEDYSHFLAESSLGTWLKEEGVPAIFGVDTRLLTKRIREKGSMLGKLLTARPSGQPEANGTYKDSEGAASVPVFDQIDWFDPNTRNLVADGERAAMSSPLPQI